MSNAVMPRGAILDVALETIDGQPASLRDYEGEALLIVNVASKCGLTPHYAGLQKLYETYRDRGLEILGFPCNQFGNQEPGTPAEIVEFCSTSYGVDFPLFAKLEVNGPGRHPLYSLLTEVPDNTGREGDILWNFEKFVITPTGEIAARFDPRTEPQDPALVAAIEAQLPR